MLLKILPLRITPSDFTYTKSIVNRPCSFSIMRYLCPSLYRWHFYRKPQFDLELERCRREGQNINTFQNTQGQTLLHLAVLENRLDQIDMLSRSIAPRERADVWGMTPTDLAYFLGRSDFLPFLQPKGEAPLITVYRNRDKQTHDISLAEFEKKLGIKYIEHLEFERPSYLRWTVERAYKQMQKKRIRKMNRWTLALHEKGIMHPKKDHVYIGYIDRSIGYGVFANRDLSALTYVGEYTGVVKQRRAKAIRLNDYVFGHMAGPKNTPFIIDAEKKGNFTRFINHSYAPNMNSRWVICKGITRIIVFTNAFVPKGTQLTYDYGKYYWRSRLSPFFL